MKFFDHVKRVGSCFIPGQYRRLSTASLPSSLRILVNSFLLFSSLALLILIPLLLTLSQRTAQEFSSLDSFVIDVNINQTNPITLLSSPKVVLDSNAYNRSGETVLFGKEGLIVSRIGDDSVWLWSDVKELSTKGKDVGMLVTSILIALLPALFVITALCAAVIIFLNALLFSILAFSFSKLSKHGIGFDQVLKICFFASVPALALALLSLPLFFLWWLPFVVFLLFFIPGVWLVGERKFAD